MKACPACGRLYPDDAGFCPVEGAALTSVTNAPLPVDEHDGRIGQVVCARYQLRRVVADGGMGRVYEALDMVERRNVALKILHAEVAGDEVAVERFKREFEVSRQLRHAHIVEVFDFQPTDDGTYALVMEFLYGEELRATLKREQTIAPARLVRLLSQVALALDAAHSRQFVHRDLKPDNLFLCQSSEGDTLKILDFGSVKDKGQGAKKLTVLGTTIGSPFYMAPEQAQGLETLDHRADVWALGAITYECVAGRVPFTGNNGPSILLEILTKEPLRPSLVAKDHKHPIPPGLDRVLALALRKNASVRTESAGRLADAVGKAYGLSGDHHDWAKTPEAELGAAIEQNLPELLAESAEPDAVDSFFGSAASLEDAGLTPMDEAFAGASRLDGADSLPVASEPARGVSWGLVAAVGGLALVVGVLIVMALVLTR